MSPSTLTPSPTVPASPSAPAPAAAPTGAPRALRLFVRQPLTRSDAAGQARVAAVLDVLDDAAGELALEYLNGRQAQCEATFREDFERQTGLPFTPAHFRQRRLARLDAADALLYVRTAPSESGAFEVSYNVFAGARAPMFFAVWKGAPIHTTLLRDLSELCDVTYVEFDDPAELAGPLQAFLRRVAATREPAGAPHRACA